MTRRCSHCSNNGHNSRTCPTRGGATTNSTAGTSGYGGASGGGGGGGGGVRLFGVRLTDGSYMKKSASMGNLSLFHSNSSAAASPNNNNANSASDDHGYLSDDPNHASCSSNRRSERKKGKPWTEEEHRLFLIGLQKLGKGDWRGIARSYVVSRTPTQVASHAQKYYIRQKNASHRKRRSSLFDMVTEEPETVPEEQLLPPPPEPRETDNATLLPSLDLSLSTEPEPMEATSTEEVKANNETQSLPNNLTPSVPAFYVPIPYPPFWTQPTIHPEEDKNGENSQQHQVLKPTPVLRKEPVNVDELVGLSQLNLSETEKSHVVPPQLSLNLLSAPSRQSAFHASVPVSSLDLTEGKNSVIQAV
ncbi:transcription factor MYBS3-like [Chenopodium quinoa]|uniref:transcription factor MYBS3-like n=1 Tax=Chenopodium quinoa TaxID=63459 RepID=UPI000B77CF12|nr:transcription factor MYBS3-like [Chenopodium quinoa]